MIFYISIPDILRMATGHSIASAAALSFVSSRLHHDDFTDIRYHAATSGQADDTANAALPRLARQQWFRGSHGFASSPRARGLPLLRDRLSLMTSFRRCLRAPPEAAAGRVDRFSIRLRYDDCLRGLAVRDTGTHATLPRLSSRDRGRARSRYAVITSAPLPFLAGYEFERMALGAEGASSRLIEATMGDGADVYCFGYAEALRARCPARSRRALSTTARADEATSHRL